jgi:hypothetical protein
MLELPPMTHYDGSEIRDKVRRWFGQVLDGIVSSGEYTDDSVLSELIFVDSTYSTRLFVTMKAMFMETKFRQNLVKEMGAQSVNTLTMEVQSAIAGSDNTGSAAPHSSGDGEVAAPAEVAAAQGGR